MTGHTTVVWLDPNGGWRAECSCGWCVPRPAWYKKRAADRAEKHLENAKRSAGLPAVEVPR